MKILLVNNLYEPNIVGGAELSVKALADALEGRGIDVLILTLGVGDTENKIKRLNYSGLTSVWPVCNERNSLKRLYFQFCGDLRINNLSAKIQKVLVSFKPDIVHTNNLAGIGTEIWKISHRLHIPVVHTLRDYYQVCARQNMMDGGRNCIGQCGKCKALTTIRKINSRFVQCVVGNSKHTLHAHIDEDYFPRAITSVISGGLTTEFLEKKKENEFKAEFSVGYIGQIIEAKGVEDVLQLATITNTKTLIAGNNTSGYAKSLKDKYSENTAIEWVGHVNALEFYRSIDILIVPSSWPEPLPRVIYEAMSQGVPVIATNVGGNPEIMTGLLSEFLYEAGDMEGLVEKFKLLRGSICQQLEEHLKSKSKEYAGSEVANKYFQIYKELSK